jgi:D-alanyl-D-alanine carboxypeptidase
LFEKNPHQKLAPASITKILTLSVALENLKKDQMITVSQEAADQEPNKIVMKAGEKLQLEDLLYGLMMISANDAARAIAESVPGGFDSFIKLMNNKVRLLGLKDTNFKNPSGLDDNEHYSTVFDIATMTRYALLEHGTEVVAYAGEKKDHSVYPTDHNESHWWSHISSMLYRYPGMIAAKTGYTDIAKSTFIGVAERNGRRLNVVLMGSTDANNDVPRLLDYGFAH